MSYQAVININMFGPEGLDVDKFAETHDVPTSDIEMPGEISPEEMDGADGEVED